MSILLQIIGSLFAVIFLHEMGHVIIAKMYGLKVSAIGIFYAPILSINIGGTKLSIGLIPMGGYTVINGLYKLEKEKQLFIHAGGILVNILTFTITLFYSDIIIARAIGIFSLTLASLNLIPADPFDGKKIFRK